MSSSKGTRRRAVSRSEFLNLSLGVAGGALAALAGPARFGFAADGPIRTRKIPSSGEALPVVGLGTARSFGYAGDRAAFEARMAAIKTLLDGGGSVIDTSPTYGDSEAIVGRALQELGTRDRAFIATKISITGEQAGIDQHRQSVQDLRTPKFDLLQIHNLRDTKVHLKTVRRLKEEGKIRYVGVTHFRAHAYDRLAEVMRTEKLDFVQLGYSIAFRDAERTLLPLARDKGIATLINVPYARGRLFSLVKGRKVPDWAREEFDAQSWGQFFLKFILADEAVTAVIPGAVLVRHVADNVGAGRGRLPTPAHRRRMVAFMKSL